MTLDLTALKREARKKGTTAARLLELAALDAQLSRIVAKSPHTPLSVLEKLAKSKDVFTRRTVAARGQITVQILNQLAADRSWIVLKQVAQHPETSALTLKRLTQHPRHTVRAACFGHPTLVFSDYLRLALDPHPYVRAAWLQQELENVRSGRSPKDTAEEWQEWLQSPDVEISRVLARHLYLLEDRPAIQALMADALISNADVKTRENAAWFASTRALEFKWNDESFWVRACVASRTLDVQRLDLLAHDANETVRRVVENRLQTLAHKGETP